MELLVFVFIVLVAVVAWAHTNSSRRGGGRVSQNNVDPEFDDFHQAIIDSAQSLVDVINESLKIANESKNADTKVSRLDVAKQRLEDLKVLSKKHSFIEITTLPQVEQSITDLEREFQHAQYREAAEGNMRGQDLEKEGMVDEAVQEYERLLAIGVDTPFTYRRLAIIYSKRKEKENELRVLQTAIENVPVENHKHYQWFAERIAKKARGRAT